MPTLQFKGKTFVQNHHLTVKYHQLVPKKDLSLSDPAYGGTGAISLHDNLIIQGDNLKALKALLPTYAGKIKCIYIDPPYNTGNEGWVYNDNVNSPMIKDWLGKVVDKEDMTKHDKWLCMMMPRLKLLRDLLSEDGAIFISIDDNEQHNLRVLLDEIFGAENFLANICWQKKQSPQNDAANFSDMHDFIISYAKNRRLTTSEKEGWIRNLIPKNEKQIARYKNPDNDYRGDWASGDLTSNKTRFERPNLYYSIINPNTNEEVWPSESTVWRYERNFMNELLKDNRLFWGLKGTNFPRFKNFVTEVQKGVVPTTWWDREFAGDNQEARREFRSIFNEVEDDFATPKPTSLLTRILQIATNQDSLILDSFAGSGTTAHAVLELNKEDGGNRKFILVEQEDYANTITAERVRRVIKGVKTAKNENLKNGLGGSFSYFELGPTIEMESILQGKNLPGYEEFARYIFYTATGEEFNEKKINEKTGFIGETKNYELYMFYKPDVEWLKRNALTLDGVKAMPKFKGKQRLVFAPAKYVDDYTCLENRIDFCQLPYEIYRIQK